MNILLSLQVLEKNNNLAFIHYREVLWYNHRKWSPGILIYKAKSRLHEAMKILAKTVSKLDDEHTIITNCAMEMIPGESISLWDTHNLWISPSVEEWRENRCLGNSELR